jgi:hypothetical protein
MIIPAGRHLRDFLPPSLLESEVVPPEDVLMRIVRGADEEQLQHLAFGRRIAFVASGLEALKELGERDPFEALLLLGYPQRVLEHVVHRGDRFRLVAFQRPKSKVTPVTRQFSTSKTTNLVSMAAYMYPKLERRLRAQLYPLVRTIGARIARTESGASFDDIIAGGPLHPSWMSEAMIERIEEPTVEEVRRFLLCIERVYASFGGEGVTMPESGIGVAEEVGPAMPLACFKVLQSIDLEVRRAPAVQVQETVEPPAAPSDPGQQSLSKVLLALPAPTLVPTPRPIFPDDATIEQAWRCTNHGAWLFWLVSLLGVEHKLLVRILVEAMLLVLPVYEKARPDDRRPALFLDAVGLWLGPGLPINVLTTSESGMRAAYHELRMRDEAGTPAHMFTTACISLIGAMSKTPRTLRHGLELLGLLLDIVRLDPGGSDERRSVFHAELATLVRRFVPWCLVAEHVAKIGTGLENAVAVIEAVTEPLATMRSRKSKPRPTSEHPIGRVLCSLPHWIPCDDAFVWAESLPETTTPGEAWERCTDGEWLLVFLSHVELDPKTMVRVGAAVLGPMIGTYEAQRPEHRKPGEVLIMLERYLDDMLSLAEFKAHVASLQADMKSLGLVGAHLAVCHAIERLVTAGLDLRSGHNLAAEALRIAADADADMVQTERQARLDAKRHYLRLAAGVVREVVPWSTVEPLLPSPMIEAAEEEEDTPVEVAEQTTSLFERAKIYVHAQEHAVLSPRERAFFEAARSLDRDRALMLAFLEQKVLPKLRGALGDEVRKHLVKADEHEEAFMDAALGWLQERMPDATTEGSEG